MSGKIYLKGVRAYGYTGYLQEENALGQWFSVDVTLWVDFEAATRNDNIDDTLDYRSCIAKIEQTIQTGKYALIERLAGAIADRLLEDPKIHRLELSVTKQPPIPNFLGTVTAEIQRSRNTGLHIVEMGVEMGAELEASFEAPFAFPGAETVKAVSTAPHVIQAIYTDGACSKNPGNGGWGVVALFGNGSKQERSGGVADTTNNQMELQAAIAGLELYNESQQQEPIELFTDSKYVIDGITKWIKGWKRNGWKTKDNQPVKNQELWQKLDSLNSRRVSWRWVEGHSGNPYNDRCDAIARAESQRV